MLSALNKKEEISQRYTEAIHALCGIAGTYHALGRSSDARRVMHHGLQLAETKEAGTEDRLKLLLQYGRILTIEYVYTNSDADLMFAILQEARQIAEAAPHRQGLADALSLLGQGHYFAVLNAGPAADSSQGEYDEALACQQQALELREALHDTRGISESYFLIGTVHERRRQYDMALEGYTKAFEIADRHGHLYEKCEPARHFAYNALIQGDLDRALTHALQALSLREEAGFRPYLPLDHLLLSDIYLKQGDAANALLHTQQAYTLAEEMGYKRALASSLLSLGDIQAARNEKAEARACYEQALALGRELQLPMTIVRATDRLEQLAPS